MATAFVTFHRGVGPNQIQAPAGHISDATPLTISASPANTPTVTEACLAEVSCDASMNITYGQAAVASTTVGQRLPAGAYGYFLWLSAGDRISVVAQI